MTTTTTLPPRWLTDLLRACTPAEQDALEEYLRAFDDIATFAKWNRSIKKLAASGAGTPQFDDYVRQQRNRAGTARAHRQSEAT